MTVLATKESQMYPPLVQEACAHLRRIARANKALHRDIGHALDDLRNRRDSSGVVVFLLAWPHDDSDVWIEAISAYIA